jgi:hypothetical protein
VRVTGDNVRTATITKGNDMPDGVLTSYTVQEIMLGTDDDGEPSRPASCRLR